MTKMLYFCLCFQTTQNAYSKQKCQQFKYLYININHLSIPLKNNLYNKGQKFHLISQIIYLKIDRVY